MSKSKNHEQPLPTLHQLLSQEDFVTEQALPVATPEAPVIERGVIEPIVSVSANLNNIDYSSSLSESENKSMILEWARRRALLSYYKIEFKK